MEQQAEAIEHPDVVNQSLENDSGGVPSANMFFLIMALTVFIVFSIACTYYFFISYRDVLAQETLATGSVEELNVYRANEASELSTYGILDAEAGVIRLPIDRGIEKTLERYKQ